MKRQPVLEHGVFVSRCKDHGVMAQYLGEGPPLCSECGKYMALEASLDPALFIMAHWDEIESAEKT